MKFNINAIPVVAGILVDRMGRILISQRTKEQNMPGTWQFTGGKLKEGESYAGATVREVYEELGILVKPIEAFDSQLVVLPHGVFHVHYIVCQIISSYNPQALCCAAYQYCFVHELKHYSFICHEELLVARRLEYELREAWIPK